MLKLSKWLFRLGYTLAAKEIVADNDLWLSEEVKEKILARYAGKYNQ